MENVMIKENLDYKILEELGYNYSMMEGGYISKDRATIISIERSPYKRVVMQYKANAECEHVENVAQLRVLDAIE